MKRLLLTFFLTGVVISFLSSCNNNSVFDNYKSISVSGWEKNSPVIFNFNIVNAGQQYDLYLNVRNKTSYKYSNLWLFIEITEPDGGIFKKDTVEISIAAPNGEWLGEGFGELRTRVSMFGRDVTFSQTGVHTIKIQQVMRENNLKGISDIGFMVEKTG